MGGGWGGRWGCGRGWGGTSGWKGRREGSYESDRYEWCIQIGRHATHFVQSIR